MSAVRPSAYRRSTSDGYLAEIDECRRRHPELRILSGVEVSEPHWHEQAVAELIADGRLGRVISSVHAVAIDGDVCEVGALVGVRPAAELVRAYLAELRRMVESVEVAVLAHIDYAARSWPGDGDGFNVLGFEREHRAVLAALAERGGALEVNTSRPLEAVVVEWWIAEGGRTLTFGSDSHAPDTVGAGLASAVDVAQQLGFAPQDDPVAPWVVR